MNGTASAQPLAEAVRLIAQAERIAVLTGAGMSQESGISTFRDAHTGLWERFDPERLATPEAWRQDRELVNGWYCWRAATIRHAQPHGGHHALAQLAQDKHLTLITQNVDDLHERAGSQGVIHLHGRIDTTRCFACNRPGGALHIPADARENPQLRVPAARCRHCDGYLRPDVVWFGETLPQAPRKHATDAVRECEVLLVIGTSLQVHPAAQLPLMAAKSGAVVVEINPVPGDAQQPERLIVRASAAHGLMAIMT